MIKEIEITGFQSHSNTNIEFDKGVNVVIGSNDSGKSAIFRALAWVFQNRPLGEAFKNWSLAKKDSVTVGVQFDDAWIIKERKNGKNVYETEEHKNIEALKSDLPEEVTSVTKISEINLQSQHDRYFLLQDSPGEVARKFNEIVGLDIIDLLFKCLNSSILSLRNADSEYELKINTLEEQIASKANLDKIKPIVDRLEKDVRNQEVIENKVKTIQKFITTIHEIEEEIENARVDPALEQKVKNLLINVNAYSKKRMLRDRLSSIVSSYTKNEETLKGEVEWLNIEESVLNIKKLFDKCNSLTKKEMQLDSFIRDYKQIEKRLSKDEKELDSLTIKYKTLLKKAGVCPLCGSKM